MIDPEKLRAARINRGLSQAGLIRRLRLVAAELTPPRRLPSDGVMKTSVSRWENGHQQPVDYLDLLTTALGVTTAQISTDEIVESAQLAVVIPFAPPQRRAAAR